MSQHAHAHTSAQQIRAGDRGRTHSTSAQRGRNGRTRRREAWRAYQAPAQALQPGHSTYFPRARGDNHLGDSMRGFLRTAAILIVLYLVLIHFTGFTKDVATVLGGTGSLVKTFQGR